MSNLLSVNSSGLWACLPFPAPRLALLSVEGVLQRACAIGMDNDEIVVDYGGIACSQTQLAVFFREGRLLFFGTDEVLSNGLAWPSSFAEWREDEYHLIVYSQRLGKFLLMSESGARLGIVAEGESGQHQKVRECSSDCGNLSGLACSDGHLVAISHIYQECYDMALDSPAEPRWHSLAISELLEPVLVTAADGEFAILGKSTKGRWVIGKKSGSLPVEGFATDLSPEGFAIVQGRCFIVYCEMYYEGLFDYKVACFCQSGDEYRLCAEQCLD